MTPDSVPDSLPTPDGAASDATPDLPALANLGNILTWSLEVLTEEHLALRRHQTTRATRYQERLAAIARDLAQVQTQTTQFHRGPRQAAALQRRQRTLEHEAKDLREQMVQELGLLECRRKAIEARLLLSTPGLDPVVRARAECVVAEIPLGTEPEAGVGKMLARVRAARNALELLLRPVAHLDLGLPAEEADRVAQKEAHAPVLDLLEYPRQWRQRLADQALDLVRQAAAVQGLTLRPELLGHVPAQDARGAIAAIRQAIAEDLDRRKAAVVEQETRAQREEEERLTRLRTAPLHALAGFAPDLELLRAGGGGFPSADQGPTWWTDGMLLVDTVSMEGAAVEIRTSLENDLQAFRASGRTPPGTRQLFEGFLASGRGYPGDVLGWDPLNLHGDPIPTDDPNLIAWVRVGDRATAFGAHRLAVLLATQPDQLLCGRALIALRQGRPVGLLMPICLPTEDGRTAVAGYLDRQRVGSSAPPALRNPPTAPAGLRAAG